MKTTILSLNLIFFFSLIGSTQSNYATYKGKKWEQLEGSGKLVQLNPSVDPFAILELNNLNIKVKVETGAAGYSMNISIDDNLKDFFKWKQEDNILKLYFDLSGGKYDRWLSTNNTVVTIKAPTVETVINKGNSDLEINLEEQPAFNLLSEGNPDIFLTGKTTVLNIESAGNADINAGKLMADKIFLSSNGNADVEINTKELIEKEIKGNNDITNLFYSDKKEKTSENYNWNNDKAELISFKLKNNSMLPSKVTLISYRPDENGNGTSGFTLFSYSSKTLRFPAGTKIYLANSEQVGTVMSGAKISDQSPFLIVKKEDKGKVFNIK